MMRSCLFAVLVLATVVLAQKPYDCSYPCPATFISDAICGHSAASGKYVTFRTQCALYCYNHLHPEKSFAAVGQVRESCKSLGHVEEPRRIDVVSEYDF